MFWEVQPGNEESIFNTIKNMAMRDWTLALALMQLM